MRRLTVIAALAGLALSGFAAQAYAAQCASVADQSTYEVLSLRTQMLVLALKCEQRDAYNKNFVIRFQPVLQANDRDVLTYFRRLYGNAGQGRKDSYTTQLVNVMSRTANLNGGEYCARAGLLVNEMNALRGGEDLVAYAAVKDMAPAGNSMCPVGAPASGARAPARRR